MDKQKAIELLKQKGQAGFNYGFSCDWYSDTWLCSYVRLFTCAFEEPDFEHVLVWSLLNDPVGCEYPLDVWLDNNEIVSINKDELNSYIEHAKRDLDEAKGDPDFPAKGLELPITEEDIAAFEIGFRLKVVSEQGNKQEYGPTYIILWKSGDYIRYLEIHNES